MADTFIFDGKEVPFEPGETILKACLRAESFIPHYCYHPSMSVVATCRMCLVKVVDAGNGKPIPKLVTSCSTAAMPNMKIETLSPEVATARKGVLEFLLVNHPLDCTICDQAGECTLQDFAYKYGSGHSIVEHEKRVYGERSIGTYLSLERNRCIHCTRCVRFSQEITKTSEMGTFGRGHQLTVDTFFDFPLTDEFQGNLADICPVGAITTNDFRFKRRAWKLKSIDTVCTNCATGCNIKLYYDRKEPFRIRPRENQDINKWWMCDRGRVSFHKYFDENTNRTVNKVNGLPQSYAETILAVKNLLETPDQPITLINSGHSTLEELAAFLKLCSDLAKKPNLLKLPNPVKNKQSEIWINNLIDSNPSPNAHSLGLIGFKDLDFASLKSASPQTLILCGEFSLDFEQQITALLASNKGIKLIVIGPLLTKNLEDSGIVLASASPYEKRGTIINRDGIAQSLQSLPFNNREVLNEFQIWQGVSELTGHSSEQSLESCLDYLAENYPKTKQYLKITAPA